MKLKRYFPAFFDWFEETEHEVSTPDELLKIPWIAEKLTLPGFHALSVYRGNRSLLMETITNEGYKYWPIALIMDHDFLGLPEFNPDCPNSKLIRTV